MRRSWVALAIGVGLSAAACGGGSTGIGTGPTVLPAQPASLNQSNASAHHNKALAQAEAKRLLSLAPLPDGTTPTSPDPKVLSGPAMGTPSTSSLIDKAKYFSSTMSPAAVYAYLKAHPPAGLTDSGTSSGSDGGTTVQGIAWGEKATSYATELQTEVGVTAAKGGSLIRADGVAIWIDPRPIPDNASGPRLRVTLAGGCPARDKGIVGVTNPGGGLNHRLLPTGQPTKALICAYGGLNPPHVFGLRRQLPEGKRAARQLAATAAKISLGHTDGGTTSCPMDQAEFDVVAFAYSDHSDVDLGFDPGGCASIGNGHIRAGGYLNLRPYLRSSESD